MELSSLKVVELRQELSSRGLPTKGKKDELIARLKEALAAEDSNKEPIQEGDLAVDTQPAQQAIFEVPQVTENISEIAQKEKTEMEPLIEKQEQPVDKSVEENVVMENQKESISTDQSIEIKEPAEAAKDQDNKETAETLKNQPADEISKDQQREEIKESSVADKSEQEIKPSVVEETSMEITTEESATDLNQSDQQMKEKISTDLAKSSTSDQPANDENDKSLKRKATPEQDDIPEKKPRVEESNNQANNNNNNSAIYIKGFVRPLITRQVQELVRKYGDITKFWMDDIKTHCYVMYKEESEASKAYDNINGIVFPLDTGKAVSVGYLTSEQAEQLINFEQSVAGSRTRVNWEANIEKVKAGEELASVPTTSDSRKTRTIGIGQIAKQLAQAATSSPVPAVTAPKASTPTYANEKEQNDSNLALEDLFKKTKALPHLYYLPVSDEIANERLAKLSK